MTAILLALLAVHVVRSLLPPELDATFTLTLAFIPARYIAPAPDLPGGAIAAVTSFVTHMLVHGDWMHLLINSAWLLAFGGAVAKRLGDARFLVFSILCGVAGALAYLPAHWGSLAPVVGASGAVSGQMAGALRFFFAAMRKGGAQGLSEHARSVPLTPIGAMLRDPQILAVLGLWFAFNLGFGLGGGSLTGGGGIAWEAHLGGFLAGLVTFGLFDRTPTPPPPPPSRSSPVHQDPQAD